MQRLASINAVQSQIVEYGDIVMQILDAFVVGQEMHLSVNYSHALRRLELDALCSAGGIVSQSVKL